MSSLELKLPPLALLATFAVAMYLVAWQLPEHTISFPLAWLVSVGFAIVGAIVAISGVLAFRSHGTTVNPTVPAKTVTIVSSGIYGVTRNPMYLGFLLALAGWAIFLANLVSLVVVPFFVAYMNRFQIEPEERLLLAKFGQPYAQYMAAVRRWL